MANETSFLSRVLAKLTGGDSAKIERFQSKCVKIWKGQINIRNNEVDDLNEKKADLTEKFEDVATSVDLDAIKTTEGLESYIPNYTKKLTAVKKELKSIDEQIAEKEAEIAEFEALVAILG
jgi:predicted  nucleic acid-binding Zn-ribbon protein